MFELWDGTLNNKSFNRPLSKHITREDGVEVLKELHVGHVHLILWEDP